MFFEVEINRGTTVQVCFDITMDVDEEEALKQALALSVEASPAPVGGDNAQDAEDLAAAEMEVDSEDQVSPEILMKQQSEAQDWDEEMVPVPVNDEMLTQLLDMGVSDTRGRKALVHGGNVEGALAWLAEHQEDPDIDQPYMVRKRDTIPRAPLTEEERKARTEAIKNKIKSRREERAKQEKADDIRREKERRERGQKMDETLEERQRQQRIRDAEKRKREKEDEAKERARIRAEIARDKEIRRLNKGVLPSVLGVEGYNPAGAGTGTGASALAPNASSTPSPAVSAPTSAAPTPKAPVVAKPVAATPPAPKPAPAKSAASAAVPPPSMDSLSAEERIDQAIATVSRYRAAGDGGNALKLLSTFVRNLLDNPTDPKFETINPESAAFKSKLGALVGPTVFLKATGFAKDESDGKWKLQQPRDTAILQYAQRKLAAAETLYAQQNP